jgi:hypothetical protein
MELDLMLPALLSIYPPPLDNLTKDPGPDHILPLLDNQGVPVHRGCHRPRHIILSNVTFAERLDSLKRQWPPSANLFKGYLDSCRRTLDLDFDLAEARLYAKPEPSGNASGASSSSSVKGKGKRPFQDLIVQIDHMVMESDKMKYFIPSRTVPEKEKEWAIEFCSATYQTATLLWFIHIHHQIMTPPQFDHYRECYYYHRGQADAFGSLILQKATCNPEFLIDTVDWGKNENSHIIQPDVFDEFGFIDSYKF